MMGMQGSDFFAQVPCLDSTREMNAARAQLASLVHWEDEEDEPKDNGGYDARVASTSTMAPVSHETLPVDGLAEGLAGLRKTAPLPSNDSVHGGVMSSPDAAARREAYSGFTLSEESIQSYASSEISVCSIDWRHKLIKEEADEAPARATLSIGFLHVVEEGSFEHSCGSLSLDTTAPMTQHVKAVDGVHQPSRGASDEGSGSGPSSDSFWMNAAWTVAPRCEGEEWRPLMPSEFLPEQMQNSLTRVWPGWRQSKRLLAPPPKRHSLLSAHGLIWADSDDEESV
mmetsp:Transcript_167918/g.539345  ORF Transcript_167918/g.539345 Transcript_167918/m.539345 type:complete len:284 (-) Transcript_167918:248-1099(-)